MRSIEIEETLIAWFFILVFSLCIPPILNAEISCEPTYLEINMSLSENFTYSIYIKNIGSENVSVRCLTANINQVNINFIPANAQITRGNTTLINICINTTHALPGDYKGLIYIWNDNSHEVLEKIPLNISVKQVYQPSRHQKPLPLCMKR